MSVTSSTMTEYADLAKDYFTNVYVKMVNPDVPLKAQFGKLENAVFAGKSWIFGVKLQNGGGSANAGARKTLPAADEGVFDQGTAGLVRTYTRMAIDNLATEVTKRDIGAFRSAFAETMSDRLIAHDLEVNRQLYCNADGKLATTDATGASSTSQALLSGSDYGVTNGGNAARHIYVGDAIEFLRADGTTSIGKRTVTAVDHSTETITVDSTIDTTGAAAGGFITRCTADTLNTVAGEANGLLASVKDSVTFEGIPATYQGWKSIRFHNSGVLRAISDSLVMQTIETTRSRSRLVPDMAITQPGIVLKYSEIFLPLRRLDGQDVQLKGGYKPLAAIIHAGGAIPVIGDMDAPDGRMFFLNTGAFRMADLVGTGWAAEDGTQFVRISDQDGVEGYIRKYWNLITIQRNANAVIEDLIGVDSVAKFAA